MMVLSVAGSEVNICGSVHLGNKIFCDTKHQFWIVAYDNVTDLTQVRPNQANTASLSCFKIST